MGTLRYAALMIPTVVSSLWWPWITNETVRIGSPETTDAEPDNETDDWINWWQEKYDILRDSIPSDFTMPGSGDTDGTTDERSYLRVFAEAVGLRY